MIYTHVLNRGPAAVRSPVDRMFTPWPGWRPPDVYASGYAAGPRSLSRLDGPERIEHNVPDGRGLLGLRAVHSDPG